MKAILFDLDNTLIDFMLMKKNCTNAAVTAMIKAGLKMPKAKAIKLIFEMYKKVGIEDHTIYEKFLKKYTKKIDYKILSAGITAYRKERAKNLKPYPGVKKVLKKLKKKGLKLGIVSDAPKIMAWLRLTEIKLIDFFDVVIAYEDTNHHKPSKLPFLKALKELKVKPKEVIFVGDNYQRDIIGARKVGIQGVLANKFFTKT